VHLAGDLNACRRTLLRLMLKGVVQVWVHGCAPEPVCARTAADEDAGAAAGRELCGGRRGDAGRRGADDADGHGRPSRTTATRRSWRRSAAGWASRWSASTAATRTSTATPRAPSRLGRRTRPGACCAAQVFSPAHWRTLHALTVCVCAHACFCALCCKVLVALGFGLGSGGDALHGYRHVYGRAELSALACIACNADRWVREHICCLWCVICYSSVVQ